jgi:hypothetical protein
MKPLLRRLDRLERARQPVVDEHGVTLRERLARGRQRLRETGHISVPQPQWVVDRMRSILIPAAARPAARL